LETETDVLIVGGGLGGVAGALAALRLGRRVVLTEETDWIGGQLTAQAVPPDEHPWIEEMGCTASYRRLRNGIRDFYRPNGCYRLHPVEWNVGEASGALAAYCLDRDFVPRQVHDRAESVEDFQRLLADVLGFELAWPEPQRYESL